ncbi:hypothetical protein BGW37DRAFT_269437 [Umbelopsis sp. PMI_123]|nr:hypothetical protein BGW37DRAFT_269437 [Umbelopsis sp. PMI_123]
MPLSSVLIVGAGPAGLSLAQYLKKHGVPYRIVEKSNSARLQGYSVSVHFALEYLTLAMGEEKMKSFEEKTSVNYTKDTAFATVDSDGSIVLKSVGAPALIGYGIRANRGRLREFLMDGLDVEMDVDATGVEFTDNGAVLKTNKGDMTADVIVGADGLYSAVRASIIGDKVEELSIANLSASCQISVEEHEKFIKYSPTHAMVYGAKLDGEEGVPNLFYGVSDLSQDKKTVSVRWILSWNKNLIYKDIPDNEESLRELSFSIANRFPEPFKSLVQNTDPSEKIWLGKVCQCMPDPTWDGKQQVTLVGDAIHAMTPYRGEGLNHAIVDVALLGEQLIKAHQDEQSIGEAITAYEAEAIPRGQRAVQASYEMAYSLHRGYSWVFKKMIARMMNFMLQLDQNSPVVRLILPKTH